jgi:hypothetical protein
MRRLTEFSLAEWCRLDPPVHALREWRNDLLLARYCATQAPGEEEFLARCAALRRGRAAAVIAFEQSWALDWQLGMARRHLPGLALAVFDNSRTPAARADIAGICSAHGVPCLGLPGHRTRHANRSHGMAMSWVFERFVRRLELQAFGFLDHDLVPVRPTDLFHGIARQPVYGVLNAGRHAYWNLWAGYCTFQGGTFQGGRFPGEAIPGTGANFLYDFSRGLDTGGRNWPAIYARLDRTAIGFAPREFVALHLRDAGPRCEVELIDGAWVHIGGVGYGTNFRDKFDFFSRLRAALDSGIPFASLREEAGTPLREPARTH